MTHVLKGEGITKEFVSPAGPVRALKAVNLIVGDGEFVVITGPSGSGKTTFLHIAGLLDRPTTGLLEFDGQDTARLDEAGFCAVRGRKVGMVFQRFHLLPRRTALENVLFRFRYVSHDPVAARVMTRATLERFGLAHAADRPARLLSSGEMQRVAIARAVVLPPRLLLADEPTGNLDETAAGAVMNCLCELNRGGLAILMATHDRRLLKHATRVVECADGKISGIV